MLLLLPLIIYGEKRMNILFLTSRLPYPPYGGDKLRVFNFIKYLGKSHNIYLLSFIEDKQQFKEADELKKYCKDVKLVYLTKWRSYLSCFFRFFLFQPLQVAYYQHALMRQAIEEMLSKGEMDVVYTHLIRMAPYVDKFVSCKRLLDLTDAISLSLKRSLKYRKHFFYIFYLIEMLKVRRYERKIIKHFDCNIVISQTDKEALNSTSSKIRIVKNGVDADMFCVSKKEYINKKIVFLGNMHSFANRDAVRYFCNQVLPLIKEEITDIEFHIIGINVPLKIQALSQNPNIKVVGAVNNLSAYMSDSACFVCPIRSGAGLQNKILEAMAMGLPVVTSKVGFEGLGAVEGLDLLVANNAEDFAKKIISIVKNRDIRNTLSLKARRFIEKNYSWQQEVKHLEQIMKETIDK